MIRQIGKLVQRPITSIRRMSCDCSFQSQALKYECYGEPCEVVKIVEEEIEPPKNKEVVVKILLAPINPADINTIQGFYWFLFCFFKSKKFTFRKVSIKASSSCCMWKWRSWWSSCCRRLCKKSWSRWLDRSKCQPFGNVGNFSEASRRRFYESP